MKAVVAFTFATAAAAAAGGTRGGSHRMVLSAEMQPEVVAQSLAKVEEAWKAQAVEFSTCHQCPGPAAAFGKSCSTVMRAVVQASGGDKSMASDYMGDVCSQPVLAGWKQDRCKSFGKAVTTAMAQDGVGKHLDVANVCQSFWASITSEDGADSTKGAMPASENATKAAQKAREEDEKKEAQIEKEVDGAEADVDKEADDAKALVAEVAKANASKAEASKVEAPKPKSEKKVEPPKVETPKAAAKASVTAPPALKIADAAEASIKASKLARQALARASK